VTTDVPKNGRDGLSREQPHARRVGLVRPDEGDLNWSDTARNRTLNDDYGVSQV
jgi:hypothetical protein